MDHFIRPANFLREAYIWEAVFGIFAIRVLQLVLQVVENYLCPLKTTQMEAWTCWDLKWKSSCPLYHPPKPFHTHIWQYTTNTQNESNLNQQNRQKICCYVWKKTYFETDIVLGISCISHLMASVQILDSKSDNQTNFYIRSAISQSGPRRPLRRNSNWTWKSSSSWRKNWHFSIFETVFSRQQLNFQWHYEVCALFWQRNPSHYNVFPTKNTIRAFTN